MSPPVNWERMALQQSQIRHEILGLISGETRGLRNDSLLGLAGDDIAAARPASISQPVLRLRPAMDFRGRFCVPARVGFVVPFDSGPALPLPGLRAASPDADSNRLLGANAATWTAAHRIHLPVWARHAQSGTVAGSRDSNPQIGSGTKTCGKSCPPSSKAGK